MNCGDDFIGEQMVKTLTNLRMIIKCTCKSSENLFYCDKCMHVICQDCLDISSDICSQCKTKGSTVAVTEQIFKILSSSITSKLTTDSTSEKSTVTLFAPHVRHIKKSHNGENILHKICREDNLVVLKEYLESGADPNEQDFAGWTPLHEAVIKGNLEAAELLLEYGALVNVPAHEKFYETPLFSALIKENVEMVKLLVKYGADMSCICDRGFTIFDFCTTNDEMFRALCLTSRNTINYQIFTIPEPKIAFLTEPDDKLIRSAAINDKVILRQLSDLSKAGEVNYLAVSILELNNKYVQFAILRGVLIVKNQWCFDYIQKDGKLNPLDYILDVEGFSFKKSALNMFNKRPKLFSELYFHFSIKTNSVVTNNCKYTVNDLKELVKAGGGNVLNRRPVKREDDAIKYPYHADKDSNSATTNFYIIYNVADTLKASNIEGIRVRSMKWFITCINTFTIIPHSM